MRIAILSRNRNLYSTRRLVEAIHQHNHEAVVIDVLRCYMNITSHKPTIHYHGKELNDINAIIPRIGASVSFYGTAVVRQFELRGIYSLNPSLGITHARDKLHSLQLLASQGIGLPITGFANQPGDIDDLTKMVGGAPLVVKFIEGTQGIGVVLAETRQAADSVIQAFMGLHVNILVQEYIKESSGADIRCFVIGGEVVASMKRQAAKGDFRSNIHRGGTASLVEITEEERIAAIRSARIMGLNVAGVDILRSHRGPVVIEVNATPGLEGIEKASGKDIAGMMVRHIENSLEFHPSTRAIS